MEGVAFRELTQEPDYNRPSVEEAELAQAGYTGLMAEGDATGEAYAQVLQENEELGYSPTTTQTNAALNQEENDRMVDMLPEIIMDDNLSQEYKDQAMEFVMDPFRKETTISYKYGKELLETPEQEEENLEYMDTKAAVELALSNVDEYNHALEAIYDNARVTEDQGVFNSGLDMVTMMVPFYEAAGQAELVAKIQQGDPAAISEGILLIGSSKESLREYFVNLPLDQRMEQAKAIARFVDESSTTLGMTNRLQGKATMDAILYGDYDNVDKWVDNVFSLLDASVILAPLKWAGKAIKGSASINRVAKAEKVRNTTRPTSASRMAQETNAEKARQDILDYLDKWDDHPVAVAGTNRTDAVADAVMPEVQIGGAGLRSKVGRPMATAEKARIKNPATKELVDDAGVGALTKKEITSATAKVVHRLQDAKGVSSRNEMFQVRPTDTGSQIRGVYGPDVGGYTNAQEGVDLVSIAMRGEGVTPDQLKVMKRDEAGKYQDVEGIPTEQGDYLIAFDYNYDTKFSDVEWETLSPGRNFLDRVPLFAKWKINRHLIDPAATQDPHIILGANAAVDKSARLTKLMLTEAKVFSDKLKALPDERAAAVQSYIKEANAKGEKFDKARIQAEWGFSDSEMDALQSFRNYWDDVWAMRNQTEAKQMKQDGYLVLEDSATDTRLFGKPRAKGNIDRNRQVFDPDTEDLRFMSEAELEALYAKGGGIMQMRKPISYDGVVTDYVLYSKSDSVRSVRNSDVVYPYRDGYYQVSYDAPHFIIETVTDGTRTYEKAVATAESVKDADLYIQRLAKTNPKGTYSVRGNVKDSAERAGFERDTFETYGDSSQRARGKQLEDATAVVQNTEQSNIKSPVDAMIDSSRAMGNRVAMGDYMNATKQRFMNIYSDLMPKGPDGIPRFPARLEDIGSNAKSLDPNVADARSMYEYISYLEIGNVNGMDATWKGLFRAAAEAAGVYTTKGESFLRGVSNLAPTEIAKGSAFQAYIAMNPLRQFLLNAHQSALLLANFPKYALKGMAPDMAVFSDFAATGGKNVKRLSKLTGRSESELKLMWREFEKSGLPDSIDYNNMVRGSLTQFAESKRIGGSKVVQAATGVAELPRRVGFDAGEWVNLSSAWLAHYDKYASLGKPLTKSDFHRIGAEARNYTFNMNRAGEMPYNQNMGAMVFQFFQIPHKALLQMTANRVLTRQQRARLFAYNMLAYSLPPSAMYGWFGSVLPDQEEHPELHDAVVQGLEFWAFNKAARFLSGDDTTNINFGSLAPADAYGVYEVAHAILTTEVGEVIAKSPAGSLFFGDNPRLTNFVKTLGKFLNPVEEDPVSASQLFTEFANISSGYSNGFRARMAYKNHMAYNVRGEVTDPSVATPEAIARLFGFETMDEVLSRTLNNKMYKNREEAKKDVQKWYKEHTARLFRDGITAKEAEYQLKLMSQAFHAWKDEPWAREEFTRLLEQGVAKGDGRFYDMVLKATELQTPTENAEFFRNLPDFDPAKKKAIQETIENSKKWEFD